MSTEAKHKPVKHDLEFKKQAVQMLNTSGRPLAQVAREFGKAVF